MALKSEVLRAMLEAGATAELIVAAVEADERASAARNADRRAKDAARQRRKRERDLFDLEEQAENTTPCHAESRVTERDVERHAARQPQKEIPTPLRKTTSSELSNESSEEAASAAPKISRPTKIPIYSDSKHELWGEGVPILMQLGLKERDARSNIGRWLRDSGDDAACVLAAIQRARDHRIIDPIPWVTQSLKSNAVVIKFNAPRPGSKEDTREEMVNAIRDLRNFGQGSAPSDESRASGGVSQPSVGRLPPYKST
jgi:hypothetical protein